MNSSHPTGLPEAIEAPEGLTNIFHLCGMDKAWSMEVYEGHARYAEARRHMKERYSVARVLEQETINLHDKLRTNTLVQASQQNAWDNLEQQVSRIMAKRCQNYTRRLEHRDLLNFPEFFDEVLDYNLASLFERLDVNGRSLWKVNSIHASRWFVGAEPGDYVWYHDPCRVDDLGMTPKPRVYPAQYAYQDYDFGVQSVLAKPPGDITNFVYCGTVPRPNDEHRYRFQQIVPNVVRMLASIVCFTNPSAMDHVLGIMSAQDLQPSQVTREMVAALFRGWNQALIGGMRSASLTRHIASQPLLIEFGALTHQLDQIGDARKLGGQLHDAWSAITGLTVPMAVMVLQGWEQRLAHQRLFSSRGTAHMLIYYDMDIKVSLIFFLFLAVVLFCLTVCVTVCFTVYITVGFIVHVTVCFTVYYTVCFIVLIIQFIDYLIFFYPLTLVRLYLVMSVLGVFPRPKPGLTFYPLQHS